MQDAAGRETGRLLPLSAAPFPEQAVKRLPEVHRSQRSDPGNSGDVRNLVRRGGMPKKLP
ncbi:unnamed protein product [Soboliphyme baturini]|uniref:WH2 domain-containing protein n=1 Tax=Soboliphyme baturini TaxID=241478 RepID=A0A183J6W1_9BILA|nr:unnamed protein product [Soboliphyme baturini]